MRDVTKLAAAAADDLAAQSVKLASAADDIAALTGKAAAKSAGVAGDDLAVGAGQVSGGILSHTIHLGPFHWTVGLLLDIAIGAAVGLLLAGVLHAWHKLSGARNKG